MIDSILSLFAVGSFLFWALMFALISIFTISVERNSHFWAISATIITGIIYWNQISDWSWKICTIGALVYVIFGTIWSVWRWKNFVEKKVEEYNNGNRYGIAHLKQEVSPKNNKSQLIAWIIYWPFSAIWNLIGDVVTTVYNSMVGFYNSITERALAKAIPPDDIRETIDKRRN